MARPEIENQYKEILSASATVLKAAGFKRGGPTFRLFSDDCCGIVNFQRSQSSSADEVRFTINLGVASARLFEEHKFLETRTFEKVTVWETHLRERIGFLLPDRQDYWWRLTESSSAAELVCEVEVALRDNAIPYLRAHLSDQALINLWETGRSPGLTAGACNRYLSELKAASA